MIDLAVIGGTGLYSMAALSDAAESVVSTPFGDLSAAIISGRWCDRKVAFLARHGTDHHLLPHQVNYRGNLWAIAQLKPRAVIAVNAVGSMDSRVAPGEIGLPDQIIDYTHGRETTFFGDLENVEMHVDLTWPYDSELRDQLTTAAPDAFKATTQLVYGATQGPRLETAAEIRRMLSDGCHLVGMTGMPEAALARELCLPYASIAIVANWAAGFAGDGELAAQSITIDEVMANVNRGMGSVIDAIRAFLETS